MTYSWGIPKGDLLDLNSRPVGRHSRAWVAATQLQQVAKKFQLQSVAQQQVAQVEHKRQKPLQSEPGRQ